MIVYVQSKKVWSGILSGAAVRSIFSMLSRRKRFVRGFFAEIYSPECTGTVTLVCWAGETFLGSCYKRGSRSWSFSLTASILRVPLREPVSSRRICPVSGCRPAQHFLPAFCFRCCHLEPGRGPTSTWNEGNEGLPRVGAWGFSNDSP